MELELRECLIGPGQTCTFIGRGVGAAEGLAKDIGLLRGGLQLEANSQLHIVILTQPQYYLKWRRFLPGINSGVSAPKNL